MKLIYFDCETSGTDVSKHDIITLAMVIEYGKTVDHAVFKMKPLHKVDKKAIEINGLTDYKSYPHPDETHKDILIFLQKHINKYDKLDKAYPVAYNGNFDLQFLAKHFKDTDDDYLGSFINWRLLDPLSAIRFMEIAGLLPKLENHKLSTIADHFKIHINAHDALSDTLATREIFKRLIKVLKK